MAEVSHEKVGVLYALCTAPTTSVHAAQAGNATKDARYQHPATPA